MRRVPIFCVLLAACLIGKPSVAQEVHSHLAAECSIDSAGKEELRLHLAQFGPVLDNQVATSNKFQEFMNSRTWKPKVPVGEQMTANEAVIFGNLQEQTKIGLLKMMMEEKRSRDLRVIIEAANLAEKIGIDRYQPTDEGSEEFTIGALLVGARELFPTPSGIAAAMLTPKVGCDLESALTAEASAVANRLLKSSGISDSQAFLERIAAKYGKPIDRAKLTSDEKLEFDRSTFFMDGIKAQYGLYSDLLFLARIEEVSKLQRDVRRAAQFESPGDVEQINRVWQRWVAQGKITREQNDFSRVLNFIDEKIPTEFAKGADTSKP